MDPSTVLDVDPPFMRTAWNWQPVRMASSQRTQGTIGGYGILRGAYPALGVNLSAYPRTPLDPSHAKLMPMDDGGVLVAIGDYTNGIYRLRDENYGAIAEVCPTSWTALALATALNIHWHARLPRDTC